MIKTRFSIKNQWGRRLLCGFLALCAVFSQAGPVCGAQEEQEEASSPTPTPDPHREAYYAPIDTNAIQGWPQGPSVEATSAVVVEISTGTVLYSKNPDQRLYPASITKILTALLGCENLSMNGKVQVSQAAAYGIEPGSSAIYADTDEIFTVQQALMAVMLESANEMSLAIGETVSGSVKKFVELMNQRAAQLGCTNTHFNNPNGLPDETHYTSAGDMAKIASAAWVNPQFRKFATRVTFEVPPTNIFPETRYFLNHHQMMEGRDRAYEGVLGGKTGYTVAAGNTLVTYAKKNGLTVAVVVMDTINGGYPDTSALLDYAFGNFERKEIPVEMEPVLRPLLPCEQYILRNGGNTYPFYYTKKVYATVPTGAEPSSLERQQALLSNAPGPLLLESSYYFNGQKVGRGIQYEKEILPDLLL